MTTIKHYQPKTHVTPLTGLEMRCSGCDHWYIETRQFHDVHMEKGRMIGICPGCGTVNDLTALIPKTGS